MGLKNKIKYDKRIKDKKMSKGKDFAVYVCQSKA
jgi:hypothetical protein